MGKPKNKIKTNIHDTFQYPYNLDIIRLFQNSWKNTTPTRKGATSQITTYLLSVLYSPLFQDYIEMINIHEGYLISKEEALENGLRGYGSIDYLITVKFDLYSHILIINAQPNNPEKEGLGHLITQMITWNDYKPSNDRKMLGIASDGEKWVFVEYKASNFQYTEKRETEEVLKSLRNWLFKIVKGISTIKNQITLNSTPPQVEEEKSL